MNVAETIGYLGAIFVLATYSMRTMIPLRIAAITSNLILITYGYFGRAYPTLILHLMLLPLNAYRLREMLTLIREVKKATAGDLSMEWLKPYMRKRSARSGEVLFAKGDEADELFFVVSGRLRLRELAIEVLPGTLVGEMGLLAPGRTRTQTLECVEDSVVQRISYEQLEQLYFQNPHFGIFLLRLTTARLFANIARLENNLIETRTTPRADAAQPAT